MGKLNPQSKPTNHHKPGKLTRVSQTAREDRSRSDGSAWRGPNAKKNGIAVDGTRRGAPRRSLRRNGPSSASLHSYTCDKNTRRGDPLVMFTFHKLSSLCLVGRRIHLELAWIPQFSRLKMVCSKCMLTVCTLEEKTKPVLTSIIRVDSLFLRTGRTALSLLYNIRITMQKYGSIKRRDEKCGMVGETVGGGPSPHQARWTAHLIIT
ncbi:hypothetical protein J6590_076456 [Homalodisca vitripennis]|nr:hypothetical protein J6590_076456 [Homalodisca vitripennis]